jgi:hypothetical protein
MKGKFRAWNMEVDESEEGGMAVEPRNLMQDDPTLAEGPDTDHDDPGLEVYNQENDDNLYFEEGDLGPSDFYFIPREPDQIPIPEEEQGPGPVTAAHRVRHLGYRTLDDDSDN